MNIKFNKAYLLNKTYYELKRVSYPEGSDYLVITDYNEYCDFYYCKILSFDKSFYSFVASYYKLDLKQIKKLLGLKPRSKLIIG